MWLADSGRGDGSGRHRPDVNMIGVVMCGIDVLDVNRNPASRGVRVLGEMVVDEVPEDPERLDRDQHRDGEQRHDPEPMRVVTTDHEGESTIRPPRDLTAGTAL